MNAVGGTPKASNPDSEKQSKPEKQLLGLGLKASPAFPIVATFIYALSGGFDPGSNFLSVFAAGVIISGAALIVGALLGFLFGIPRTREKSGSEATLAANTNLNEISDWLTKILVGLGLVQLGKVTSGIESMANAAAPALGGTNEAMIFATGLLVFSAVDGFLLGYLWVRLVISVRLKESIEEGPGAILEEPSPVELPPLPPPPPSPPGN